MDPLSARNQLTPRRLDEPQGLLRRLVADLNGDVPNLEATVQRVSIQAIETAGIVQNASAEFNSLILSSSELFLRHSAFYLYHAEAVFASRRALREALCSYYGAAGALLRGAYEAILRGAFWDCLAHQRYRDHAEVVGKQKRTIEGIPRNILNWLSDVFQAAPQIQAQLEKQSGAIFDCISPLFEKRVLRRVLPPLRTMVEQLSAWKMFEPITDSVSEVYDRVYSSLCLDTHLIPDKTMMGRLMVAGKDPSTIFEPSQEEFDRFLTLFCCVAEIGALVMLNLVEDDAHADEDLRARVASILPTAEDAGLSRVALRLRGL